MGPLIHATPEFVPACDKPLVCASRKNLRGKRSQSPEIESFRKGNSGQRPHHGQDDELLGFVRYQNTDSKANRCSSANPDPSSTAVYQLALGASDQSNVEQTRTMSGQTPQVLKPPGRTSELWNCTAAL